MEAEEEEKKAKEDEEEEDDDDDTWWCWINSSIELVGRDFFAGQIRYVA